MANEFDSGRINKILESLIFDRMQADVDYALTLEREGIHTDEDLRGAYNASDRNRVGGAVNYIAALMRLFDVRTKDSWDETSIAKASDNENTIYALNRLKQYLPIDIQVPADLDRLSYIKANDIERVLFEIYGVYERINGLFVGDGYASGFDAENTQIFDGNRDYSF